MINDLTQILSEFFQKMNKVTIFNGIHFVCVFFLSWEDNGKAS